MAELLKPWMLPGPANFVARVCSAADRQKVVVVHAPFEPQVVAEALKAHLERDGRYLALGIGPEAAGSFECRLATVAGMDSVTVPSAAALATSPRLDSVAIVIRNRGAAEAGLAAFARMLGRQPKGEGPVLLVVSEDGACSLEGHALEPIRSVFGPLDGAAYAAAMPRPLRALEARLVASVAIEVAAWDVGLLDRLTALPPELAVRPDCCVNAWDDGQVIRWRGLVGTWEAGCVDDWGGEPVEHALWLAANRPTALTKRVWRGQLMMLLPWIEQYRQMIIERERRSLRADTVRSGPDVESLDWGPLAVQLERVPELKKLLRAFREARNELAHGRPITWTHIKHCIDAARAYSPAAWQQQAG
jgi:hypothetical protein